MILSAFLIVDNLCAITMVVRFFIFSKLSRASCTTLSEVLSRALVASSRMSIFGSLTIARAMATLCFCPPDSCTPFSPTWVSYPSGNAEMKS
mmetsp:Transcript_26577/g.25444  ORF Transcript_26577/g.25444 Transcript_26577/m.25444 type:complete len:92 (-) Transcript_26577:1853-2128(-)